MTYLQTITRSASQQFVIRPLTSNDALAYRALRQKILDLGDGRWYSDSYIREQQLSKAQWPDWCAEQREHCIIGTFANNELVGVMMITQQNPPHSPLVEWEATWLDPRYRKTGLARPAYELVSKWSKGQGYKYAVAFIRSDNTRSQDIRVKQGFVYAYTLRNEVWADGSVADLHAFLLDLRTPREHHRCSRSFVKDALAYLDHGPHAPIYETELNLSPQIHAQSLIANSR